MNMQSSSGNYSMAIEYPRCFNAAACISGGTTFGRMLAQEYLEGQSCKKKESRK